MQVFQLMNKNNNNTLFTCVQIIPAENLKSHARKGTEGHARARFAFQAQTAMEMSISKGEIFRQRIIYS